MGSVAVETTTIRELLQQQLPQIVTALGEIMPAELTAEEIISLLGAAAVALSLREPNTSSPAAGLHVPALPADTLPAIVAGSPGVNATGIYVQTAGAGVLIDTTSADEPALAGNAAGGIGVRGANNSAAQPAIWAQNSGAAAALRATTAGETAIDASVQGVSAAVSEAVKLTRGDTSNAVGTGLATEYHFNGHAPTLSGLLELYISAANNTNFRFWIRRTGNMRQVFILDSGTGTTNTSIWVEFNGAMVRVKAGAAGTGPGGAGRALYLD